MAPTEPKQLLKEFIHCYRSHSVLWDVSKKGYYQNKVLRNAAYWELQKVLQKYRKDATLDDVKRKINTLRCTYRKELNKIRLSKSSGAGVDNVYVPSLWWFESMNFLSDLMKPVPSLSTMPDSVKNEYEICFETVCSPIRKKKQKQKQKQKKKKQEELLSMECEFSTKDKTEKDKEEDQFLNTARTWADKLQSLSRKRQLMVEKKINDIFFEALMAEEFPEEEEVIRHGEQSEYSSLSSL